MPEIHSRLAELLSAKKQESYPTTNSWVRAKVSFAILRSALLCLRGSRTPRRRHLDIKDRDLEIEKGQLGLPWSQQLQILYYGDVHRNFHFLVYRQLFYICSVENHQTTKKSFLTKFVLKYVFCNYQYYYYYNHNCNKIVKSDWLSTALVSALMGQVLKQGSVRHS